MPNITADKIIGHNIYAKSSVEGYNLPEKPNRVIRNYKANQLIGNVFSWVERTDGLYWVVYEGLTPIYIKHVTGKLDVKELPEIIAEINRKAEEAKKEQKGAVPYYIEKYLPWILGAIALSIIVPALRRK